MNTPNLIKAIPKLEQHVHLIGSTQPKTLLWIMQDSGAKSSLKTLEDIKKFYKYTDFNHFIRVYSSVNDLVTKESYYELITYELLQSESACNVQHVEAIFSAFDHVRRGMDYGKMLNAINTGIFHATRDFGITCSIRVDLVRNYGPEIGNMVLDWIRENGRNVVGIDIGGSEKEYPPEPYEQVYLRAKKMGLHLVAHAGEVAGPESVRGAVERLGVERIGHGVTVAHDPELMILIKNKGITIEACPVSNLRTGAVKNLHEHPIREFIRNGINVTVNSDDPSMFGTDMNNEYLLLNKELGFTPSELAKISFNAVNSAFLLEKRKQMLKEYFQTELFKMGLDQPREP